MQDGSGRLPQATKMNQTVQTVELLDRNNGGSSSMPSQTHQPDKRVAHALLTTRPNDAQMMPGTRWPQALL